MCVDLNALPIRSAGPVPRFSPRMVTLVQAAPSLGEMPVTKGGWRARDMAEESHRYRKDYQHLECDKGNLHLHITKGTYTLCSKS